jgi:hypothetical protein
MIRSLTRLSPGSGTATAVTSPGTSRARPRPVKENSMSPPDTMRLASPGVREQVLSQLPAPARLLYRTVWLPRYARITPAL